MPPWRISGADRDVKRSVCFVSVDVSVGAGKESLPREEFKCLPASLSLLPHALTRRYTSGHASAAAAAAARTMARSPSGLLFFALFIYLFIFYAPVQIERFQILIL